MTVLLQLSTVAEDNGGSFMEIFQNIGPIDPRHVCGGSGQTGTRLGETECMCVCGSTTLRYNQTA